MDPIDVRRTKGRLTLGVQLLLLLVAGVLTGLLAGALLRSSAGPVAASGEPADAQLATAPARFSDLLRIPDSLARASAIAEALLALPQPGPGEEGELEEAAEALRRVFEQSPLPDGDVELAMFAGWWAGLEPEAAYSWTRVAPQAGTISVLAAVFEQWGRVDPEAAVAAAQTEDLEIRRQAALAASLIGAAFALQTRARLAAIAGAITDRQARRRAVQALATRLLAEEDPKALMAESEAAFAPERSAREDFVAGIATAAVGRERIAALEALSRLSFFGEGAGEAVPADVVASIASVWGVEEPEATFEWLSSLPASEARSGAVRSTYERWVGRDRQAALDWAAARAERPESWLDPVRATYGFIIGHEDPVEGLRILQLLPVERERAFKVERVYARWKAVAPEAAEGWLSAVDLPDFRKQELRRLPPRPPLRGRRAARGDS